MSYSLIADYYLNINKLNETYRYIHFTKNLYEKLDIKELNEIREFLILIENQIRFKNKYSSEKLPTRNSPCPCGSGKKYKKCCGKNI